jgi:diaminobutyrate-2-oxoglutarate transaminase
MIMQGHADLPVGPRVTTEQLGRPGHGLDLPTPAKDAITEAPLSVLLPAIRGGTRVHFCGPTGVDGVDAGIKLRLQGGFHAPPVR